MLLGFIDSPAQLAVVFLVLLVIFGPDKLPGMMRQLGRGIREFKRYTVDLSSNFRLDDPEADVERYNSEYRPVSYDSYGNPIPASAVKPEYNSPSNAAQQEFEKNTASSNSHVGDFASPAMQEHGVEQTGQGTEAAKLPAVRTADHTEPRT